MKFLIEKPQKWKKNIWLQKNWSMNKIQILLLYEPAFYSLIMLSNKHIAKKFQEVVYREILLKYSLIFDFIFFEARMSSKQVRQTITFTVKSAAIKTIVLWLKRIDMDWILMDLWCLKRDSRIFHGDNKKNNVMTDIFDYLFSLVEKLWCERWN